MALQLARVIKQEEPGPAALPSARSSRRTAARRLLLALEVAALAFAGLAATHALLRHPHGEDGRCLPAAAAIDSASGSPAALAR